MGICKRISSGVRRVFLDSFRVLAPMRFARYVGVRFGKGCHFIYPKFGTEPYLITIGDHVELTNGVTFITHDGGAWVFREEDRDIDVFGPITIGNNVFVGIGTIILPNVRIGNNCVIGAGSVVTKDIPSDSIAAGVPAKVIKTIAEYRESVKQRAFYIRNLPVREKRRILREKFG